MALKGRLAAIALLTLCTPALVLSVQQSPGLDDGAIKLNTRWVNLNISATDHQGKKVTQLKREDFVILEDGVPQEIVHFAPVDAPVNLVLLLDLSGSIGSKLKAMKKAANRFVDSLKDNDRMAMAVFTSRFKLVADFTGDHKRLKDCIDHIKHPGGGTALYDAEWKTLDLLRGIQEARRAIVVLTDGVDSSFRPDDDDAGSTHRFDELLTRAAEEDTTIYPIYFDTEADWVHHYSRENYTEARQQLRSLAEQTGGAYFAARRIEDLDGVYRLVAEELHALYSLAYAAKDTRKDGRFRAIKLKVNREGIVAKTRRGYFAQ
ncbi:MAG TPA: VWA domain-containing protein [Blastocatellia bacterium]|nr:VWA domain-containing protein [Blastocatellia bacterium]